MLSSGKQILMDAKQKGRCIPQFNINNLEWVKAIMETFSILDYPVILGVSESSIKYMGGYNTVVGLVEGLIKDLKINIPIILHLDHGSSIESCIKAIDSGFTSVMIDASSYDIDTNIEITSKVVDYAKHKDVMVEGEIGHIGGSEDGIKSNITYTNVLDAIRYVNETNIDLLAPAIGNKHGVKDLEPQLNIDLLKELNEKIKIPLVLHGGSGISDEQLIKTIENGINKININTELQVEWSKKVKEYIINNNEVYDPRKIIGAGIPAIKDIIIKKSNIFITNKR